jgi:bZIP transcription factor
MEEQRGSQSDADESKEFGSAKRGAASTEATKGEGSDDDDDTISFGDGKTNENPSGKGTAPDLDKYTIIRREKRLAMNRESARNRRQRKKQLIQSLDEQALELRKSNQQLQTTNDSLSVRIRVLESELAAARTTIHQLTHTGAMPNVPTPESSAISFQSQLPNQAQFLQQHATQPGLSQSQPIVHPVYPNSLGAPLNNPSTINVNPLSLERNNTCSSDTSNLFDPLRSFGMDTQRPTDRAGMSGGISQSIPEVGGSHLSRLVQAQLDHLGRQGMPSATNVPGGTGSNPSWGFPTNVGTVAPCSFPSMEDSLRGVSTNWEMTERHDLPSTRGGIFPHLNRNTVSFFGP